MLSLSWLLLLGWASVALLLLGWASAMLLLGLATAA
jgi:hypothetical protein